MNYNLATLSEQSITLLITRGIFYEGLSPLSYWTLILSADPHPVTYRPSVQLVVTRTYKQLLKRAKFSEAGCLRSCILND